MLVVRGLLLLLKQLVLALSQLPLDQSQDLSVPPQQLLAGCGLPCPRTPWPPEPCELHYPHHHRDIGGDTRLHLKCDEVWLMGSLVTALGACLAWTELFQLPRNATKLSFSHQLWKYAQCSWSHSVFFGVWQKMSSTLCYWDTWGHFFCMVMERAFLVSRMLAAVISNPESGLFDQRKPPWTWNLTICLCVAKDGI